MIHSVSSLFWFEFSNILVGNRHLFWNRSKPSEVHISGSGTSSKSVFTGYSGILFSSKSWTQLRNFPNLVNFRKIQAFEFWCTVLRISVYFSKLSKTWIQSQLRHSAAINRNVSTWLTQPFSKITDIDILFYDKIGQSANCIPYHMKNYRQTKNRISLTRN